MLPQLFPSQILCEIAYNLMFLTKEIYWLMFYMFTSTITGVNCPLFLLMAKIVNSHDHIKKIDEGE